MKFEKHCVDCSNYGGAKDKPPIYISDWCDKLEIYLPDASGYAKQCRDFISRYDESQSVNIAN